MQNLQQYRNMIAAGTTQQYRAKAAPVAAGKGWDKTCCCFLTITQSNVGMLERCGKFSQVLQPGCHCMMPCGVDEIAGTVSLRTNQLDVRLETKTADNVFVRITACVQYLVRPPNAHAAFYSLDKPLAQISSFVENAIRSKVAIIDMDDLFTSKDAIAKAVLDNIDSRMQAYGFDILESLVTDIDPEASVKTAMNAIVEARRMQTAAEYKGEADKIISIKDAEARKQATILTAQGEAHSKQLQGEGIAKQREAIVSGLSFSVANFAEGVGCDPYEAMSYVVLTQHYDTLKEVAERSNTSTLFTPHTAERSSMGAQMQEAVLRGNAAADHMARPVQKSMH
jgi:regulator of protease activity HflC (stomatin/prohibitin superfamily)